MAALPYVTSSGNIERALSAIKAAAVPERVSQDFVKDILKIPGGSGDQMTAYLKKINFAGSDGKPTELYTRFRNPTTSGQALAQALKFAYAPLFVRNESAHNLNDNELLGLIVEETGQPHDSSPVKMAFSCFKALRKHANFSEPTKVFKEVDNGETSKGEISSSPPRADAHSAPPTRVGLNLGYTINLNLPATSDPAVFNAIFKSLKQHLLNDDDA